MLDEGSFEQGAPVPAEEPRRRSPMPSPSSDTPASSEDEARKPSLDEMIAKLPPENRRTVEELFRGKFTAVRRLDRSKLG